MKTSFLTIGLVLAILSSCGSEESATFTFDKEEYGKDPEKYVVSNGEMDIMSCGMTSVLFNEKFINKAKDLVESGKSGDEFGLAIFEIFDELSEDDPYLSIKLTESEVDWIGLSEKSKIESNKFSFPIILENEGDEVQFTIVEKTDERLILNTILDEGSGASCNYPFKSIKT
jgi:hypothetical protein